VNEGRSKESQQEYRNDATQLTDGQERLIAELCTNSLLNQSIGGHIDGGGL
jgi:hypothetical protein